MNERSFINELIPELQRAHAGEYLKFDCPFHDGGLHSKTLWVDRSGSKWSCWSTRCAYSSGGSLRYLLYLCGYKWKEAGTILDAMGIAPEANIESDGISDQGDIDRAGIVQDAHLAMWAVDWHLADAACRAAVSAPGYPDRAFEPLSEWADSPAAPGTVEHDHWNWLGYMLVERRIPPAGLSFMGVAYDPDAHHFVFPLRTRYGELAGIGRRYIAAQSKRRYVTSRCVYPVGHEQYHPIHVDAKALFWGWWENRHRIGAGHDIHVVEGYLDQVKLCAMGYCALAKNNRRLTKEQVKYLYEVPNPVIMWPDNDVEGLSSGGIAMDCEALAGRPNTHIISNFYGKKDASRMSPFGVRLAAASRVTVLDFPMVYPQLLLQAHRLKSAA